MAESTLKYKIEVETKEASNRISELDDELGKVEKLAKTMSLSEFSKSIKNVSSDFNNRTAKMKDLQHALAVSQIKDTKDVYEEKQKYFKAELAKYNESYRQNRASLMIMKQQNKEMQERNLLNEEAREQIQRQRGKLDEFRQGGITLSGIWKNLKSAPNEYFNQEITKGRRRMDINTSQIKDIDEWFATNQSQKGSEQWKDKELEKKQLEGQNKQLTARNAKMAAAQMAINTAINTVKKFGEIGSKIFQTMGLDIKNIFKDVIGTIGEALKETGIASYSMSTSLFTNASARETQMKYGLSGESAYALTQTMGMLNMKSDEDLMYMNERQKEAFNNIMDKYKTWYSNLESTGAMEKMQEAQLEFKMFKEELSMKLLNWFAEHKDQIFNALEVTMNVLSVLAELVLNILNLIPGGKKYATSSATSSDISSVNTNNKISNVNINVNNTNNANATLNSQSELENSLNNSNGNLVKSIAASLAGY